MFVDAVDEVTELLESTRHGIEPWQLLRNANVIGDDGHSNYAAVLERFWRDVGERDLHRTSTVIVTGDARTNHRGTGQQWLQRVAERSRRVYWLNPEPARRLEHVRFRDRRLRRPLLRLLRGERTCANWSQPSSNSSERYGR